MIVSVCLRVSVNLTRLLNLWKSFSVILFVGLSLSESVRPLFYFVIFLSTRLYFSLCIDFSLSISIDLLYLSVSLCASESVCLFVWTSLDVCSGAVVYLIKSDTLREHCTVSK